MMPPASVAEAPRMTSSDKLTFPASLPLIILPPHAHNLHKHNQTGKKEKLRHTVIIISSTLLPTKSLAFGISACRSIALLSNSSLSFTTIILSGTMLLTKSHPCVLDRSMMPFNNRHRDSYMDKAVHVSLNGKLVTINIGCPDPRNSSYTLSKTL